VSIKVNDEIIDQEAIVAVRLELEAQDRSFAALPEADQLDRAENAIVERVLVRQAAASDGPEIRPVDIKREVKRAIQNAGGQESLEKYLERSGLTVEALEADVELRLKIDGLLDRICAAVQRPTDETCLEFYQAHPEQFRTEEHIRASHIIAHTTGNILDEHAGREALLDVRRQIEEGKPFSTFTGGCNDCGDDHGDMGYFGRGTMVPEFEEVVFALKPGEVSDVFKTRFGHHIVKVLDYIPSKPREFEEVREEVRQYLFEQAENACIDAFTAELKGKAMIVRDS
jgi:hypothetical protein